MTAFKWSWLRALLLCVMACAAGTSAATPMPDFRQVFERHTVPMLLMEPETGRIVDANPAAVGFYGHDRATLTAKSIQDINTLDAAQVEAEWRAAEREHRNYFIFRHRLASGDIRSVEVHSQPFDFGGRRLLLSMVLDITPGRNIDQGMWHFQQRLEELVAIRTGQAQAQERLIRHLLVGGLVLLSVIVVVLSLAIRRRKRLEAALQTSTHALAYRQALYGALFEEANFLAGVLDQQGRLVEINRKAFEAGFNCIE